MSPEARSSAGDERRISIRTLAIASVASATAAIVTSMFWRGGTPIAAAVTPVIVSLVSEMLHRPTAVIAEKLTTERDALPGRVGRGLRVGAAGEDRPTVPAEQADPAAERDLEAIRALRRDAPAAREAGRGMRTPAPNGVSDVSVYRPPVARRRRLPLKLITVTALLAFVIGTAIVTVPELVAGRSIGHGDRQFSVLGGTKSQKSSSDPTEEEAQPTQTTETQPEEEPQQQAPAPDAEQQMTEPETPATPKIVPDQDEQTTETMPQTTTTPTAPKASP